MNQISGKFYNFIACNTVILYLSICLLVLSFLSITKNGFNWGLDFTGGLFVEVIAEKKLDLNAIRDSFIKSGFQQAIIQYSDTETDVIIRIPIIQKSNIRLNQGVKDKILDILNNNINQKFTLQQMNWIGPSSGKDLITKGIISFSMALLCIFLYITFRFELKLAISVIFSLIYDTIIILAILSFLSIEINSTIIAALISAIGYCLNDNIIIFDRIRENFNCMPNFCSKQIFNLSLNQVLNRTIITSVTTIMVLIVLLIFGGKMLYEFSIVLLIGIIVGTISSVYIASLLAYKLKIKHKNFEKKLKNI